MSESPANRVPPIVLLYWVIKIAATTLGETGADMASMTFDLGYATTIAIFLALFLGLGVVKLRLAGYHPLVYWLTFTASAIAGTAVSDFLDRTAGLGYLGGSALLTVLLLVLLAAWRWTEGTVSVERIETPRAELFYWTAFLLANTLGTAAGDYLADDLELGFLRSAGLSGLLVVIAALHRFTKAPTVLLFWLAFVLTRPLGATFGDLLTKSVDEGGIAFGTIGSSLVFGVVLVAAIAQEARLHARRLEPAPIPAVDEDAGAA